MTKVEELRVAMGEVNLVRQTSPMNDDDTALRRLSLLRRELIVEAVLELDERLSRLETDGK